MTAAEVLADPTMLRSSRLTAKIGEIENAAALGMGALASLPMLSLLEDWYRLRMGSDIALDRIPADHVTAYNAVANTYREQVPENAQGLAGRFALLFRIFTKCRDGLPSRDFSIDLGSGDICEIGTHDRT